MKTEYTTTANPWGLLQIEGESSCEELNDELGKLLKAKKLPHEEKISKADEIFRKFNEQHLLPNVYSYRAMMQINIDNYAVVVKFFDDMKDAEILPDKKVYHVLISASGKAGDYYAAARYFSQIGKKDDYSYNCMLEACAKTERFSEAKSLFSQMKANKVKPTEVTFQTLLKISRSSDDKRLECLCNRELVKFRKSR